MCLIDIYTFEISDLDYDSVDSNTILSESSFYSTDIDDSFNLYR